MNKIIAILNKLAANIILSKKDEIIAAMNKKIDIPFASESDEKELLEGIWELLEEALADAFAAKK